VLLLLLLVVVVVHQHQLPSHACHERESEQVQTVEVCSDT
jgi:hypothetical protein